jgi:hypothetical protein
MAVDPVTSLNTTVTILRTSWAADPVSESGAAQFRQNFALSGFSSPHEAHVGTAGV